MRFLGIGEDGDLADMYYRLARAGHEVRMHIESCALHGIHAGMVDRTPDWRAELPWIRDAGANGVIIFESVGRGELQDRLRREGFQVIGGSAFGDRLECDRVFGQDQLARCGLPIARTHRFAAFEAAIQFVKANPARYVFKANGADSLRTRNYVGDMKSGADMIALLSAYQAQWKRATQPDFVLMEHVEGVEVGVGAYFNGDRFIEPVCLDWEHKRFFPGDLGELTGEMGTVVTYRGAERIFGRTLALMSESLRQGGYCGYINLNLMANEQGLWPIEFTSRFGYPGYAICEALHEEPWDTIFLKLLNGRDTGFFTRPGYAAGVALTVPPFPHSYGYDELSKGLPITFRESMTESDRDALHFAEVAMDGEQLVTSGVIGYVGVATGTGESVAAACDAAYAVARKVVVPNLRYRTDIGERVMRGDLAKLVALDYIAA